MSTTWSWQPHQHQVVGKCKRSESVNSGLKTFASAKSSVFSWLNWLPWAPKGGVCSCGCAARSGKVVDKKRAGLWKCFNIFFLKKYIYICIAVTFGALLEDGVGKRCRSLSLISSHSRQCIHFTSFMSIHSCQFIHFKSVMTILSCQFISFMYADCDESEQRKLARPFYASSTTKVKGDSEVEGYA